ncbi:MAG: hypothetical protein C0498_01610 [Anaerolinea sp.]|nr:hypothetical protein [Anaerolinea sp.]
MFHPATGRAVIAVHESAGGVRRARIALALGRQYVRAQLYDGYLPIAWWADGALGMTATAIVQPSS